MVWIFFLSTNWKYFQQNQLSASILGPEPHEYSFYLFQIESSGIFLTNHISTMLYHIASGTSKLGQFRWSGFFSHQQTGTVSNGINYRHLSSDRKTHGYTFHLSQIESSGTFLTSHISTMLYHTVSGTSKLGQFRWSVFFSYQQTGTIFDGINYRHLSSDRKRIDISSIFPKSNLPELFSQATFPQSQIT